MPKNNITISIDPTEPHHGDELTVTITGSAGLGVFSISCAQDGNVVYGDGGNDRDNKVTLSSLSWTGGAASCVIEAREQRKSGNPYTAAKLEFQVLG